MDDTTNYALDKLSPPQKLPLEYPYKNSNNRKNRKRAGNDGKREKAGASVRCQISDKDIMWDHFKKHTNANHFQARGSSAVLGNFLHAFSSDPTDCPCRVSIRPRAWWAAYYYNKIPFV